MQNNPSVQKTARNEMRKAERRRGGGGRQCVEIRGGQTDEEERESETGRNRQYFT